MGRERNRERKDKVESERERESEEKRGRGREMMKGREKGRESKIDDWRCENYNVMNIIVFYNGWH